MNKTVSAHIGGFVFNIDENAYQILAAYLERIRRSFATDDSREEIMADIELRIAELFKEKLSEHRREVVHESDVAEIMETMGQPEDFEGAAEGTHEEKEGKNAQQGSEHRFEKQIFRDPDDRLLGGVCSGLSAYFGWDPLFLRIIFVLLFFGFGTGIILYFVLWIIIPEARNSTDRLKMRGEKIDVETIKQRFKDFQHDVEDLAGEKGKKRFRNASHQLADYFQNAFGAFATILAKVIGFAMLVLAIVLLVVFIKWLFTNHLFTHINDTGIHGMEWKEWGYLIFGSETRSNLVGIGIFCILIAPAIALIIGAIRLMFNIRYKSRTVNFALSTVSSIGIILLIVMGIQTGVDFSKEREIKNTFSVPTASEVLYLNANADPYFSNHVRPNHEDDGEFILSKGKKLVFGYPRLQIEMTETNQFSLQIERSAHANNQSNAIKRAEHIEYHFEQSDSLISFDPFFTALKSDLFRAQELNILVRVPRGKAIHLAEGMDRIIYDIPNVEDMEDRDMCGKTWYMTDKGLSLEKSTEIKKPEKNENAEETESEID